MVLASRNYFIDAGKRKRRCERRKRPFLSQLESLEPRILLAADVLLTEFAVFSTDNLNFGKKAVVDGQIGSNSHVTIGWGSQTQGIEGGGRLSVGKRSTIDGDIVFNGHVRIKQDGYVNGDIDAGRHVNIDANTTVAGDVRLAGLANLNSETIVTGTIEENSTPSSFTSVTLPAASSIVVDEGNSIDTEPGEQTTLPPGVYGNLNLDSGNTLNLSAGEYSFKQMVVGQDLALNLDVTNGEIAIFVAGDVMIDKQLHSQTIGGGANQVYLETHGQFRLKSDGDWLGTVFAPHEKITFDRNSSVVGALYGGKSIRLDAKASLESQPARRLFNSDLLTIDAALSNDTGADNNDGKTFDPSISGSMFGSFEVTSLRGRINSSGSVFEPDQFVEIPFLVSDDLNSNNVGIFFVDEQFLLEMISGPLEDGDYSLDLVATDALGNVGTATVPFSLDTEPPSAIISAFGTIQDNISSFEVVFDEDVAPGAFDLENYRLVVGSGPNFDSEIGIAAIDPSSAFSATINLLDALADGTDYRFIIEAAISDIAGNVTTESIELAFSVGESFRVSSISPADGTKMVSPTREAIIRFSEPVDPATVNSSSIQTFALGEIVPGDLLVSSTNLFATFFPDDPWNPSTEFRIEVNGDQILSPDGSKLDADSDGIAGGTGTSNFRTLPLTRIAGTNVFGFVRDSVSGEPIVGATIRVDAFPDVNAITDENGRFELEDMPAPAFFVHIDGSTATNVPFGFNYPNVGKPFHSQPGQTIHLQNTQGNFDVYLPRIALTDIQSLSGTTLTDVGFGDVGKSQLGSMFPDIDPTTWDQVKVTFAPDAAVDEKGNPATEAVIVPVAPDRIPAPLPENLNPDLIISIQALGATNFDVPAPVSFPNLEGLAPGEKALFFSFDHDAGEWVVIGPGTVSADGSTIDSDKGVGILAPGWHFVTSGTRTEFKIAANGSGYGVGFDFLNTDFPIQSGRYTPSLFDQSLISFGRAKSTAELTQEFRDYMLALNTGSLGQQMVTRFVSGTGGTFTHGPGSTLSNMVKNDSDTFASTLDSVKNDIQKQIQAQANGGRIDNRDLNVSIPNLSFKYNPIPSTASDPHALKSMIGGTQGRELSTENFNATATIVSPEVGGSGTYAATLRFRVFDDFGVDESDIYAPSLAAFWLLQHERIGPKAFINEIIVEVPISGTFVVPPGFEEVEIEVSQLEQNISGQDGLNTADSISTSPGFGSDPRVFYRFEVENGVVLTGAVDPNSAVPNFVLPPDQYVIATFYQPSTNLSTQIASITSTSGRFSFFSDSPGGQGKQDSKINLDTFGGFDADGDGLPDIGELAIGTDPESFDTDSDGVRDAAEIEQGLDPLGGLAFPTGVISSLPLAGTSEDLTVEGNDIFVATGSAGLAIVDGTQFDNPILLGQLDLNGRATGVGVDPNLNIAAVATGVSLELIDVSDKRLPSLRESLAISATRVVVNNGLAYATGAGTLHVVDLISGKVLQTLNLPFGGSVTDVARDGSFLYAFASGEERFSVIDISTEGAAQVTGQLSVSIGTDDVGVFAGNGVAWLAGNGLWTVDIGDPNAPNLIQGADDFFTSRRIALNGSGIGVMAPDGNSFVEVFDTSDPNYTQNLVVQFPLSSSARDVAISRGVGYVGTSAGLEVVNYLPFDSLALPPTVSISTSVTDADSDSDGIQVIEGRTIPIQVDVTDDVQVRSVELLVNGEFVRNDVSFPYDFSAIALGHDPDDAMVTIQARAVDTGGNASLSDALVIELVPDTFSPSIVNVDPDDGDIEFEGISTLRLRFDEPIDIATINSATISIVEAGDGGVFGDGNDIVISPIVTQIRDDDSLVQITTTPLVAGAYQIIISEPLITDRAGNPLGVGVDVRSFTVEQSLPDSLINGNFETGDFTGWTVVNSGTGNFYNYGGTISPESRSEIPGPAGGSFAAVSDQGGPGSHILYQDVFIPDGESSAILSFDLFVQNQLGFFAIPDSISEDEFPNQQARVDIMDPTAPVNDVGAGVLLNVFRTLPDFPAVTNWIRYTADVSQFAGTTVRIRFAEVDNQLFFQFGVDNVSLVTRGNTSIPSEYDVLKIGEVDSLQQSVDEMGAYAVSIWEAALGKSLSHVEFKITDLPSGKVGEANITTYGDDVDKVVRTVVVDIDADGAGWFVDKTPDDNVEFDVAADDASMSAIEESPAFGKRDLLTVILHELGHVAGFTQANTGFAKHIVTTSDGGKLIAVDDLTARLKLDGNHLSSNAHADDLMNAFLDVSVRRLPSSLDIAILANASSETVTTSANLLAATVASAVTVGRFDVTYDRPDETNDGPSWMRPIQRPRTTILDRIDEGHSNWHVARLVAEELIKSQGHDLGEEFNEEVFASESFLDELLL